MKKKEMPHIPNKESEDNNEDKNLNRFIENLNDTNFTEIDLLLGKGRKPRIEIAKIEKEIKELLTNEDCIEKLLKKKTKQGEPYIKNTKVATSSIKKILDNINESEKNEIKKKWEELKEKYEYEKNKIYTPESNLEDEIKKYEKWKKYDIWIEQIDILIRLAD